MKQFNIHYAKTHFSDLLSQVEESGEEIVIARAGKPVARLVRETPERQPRRLAGSMKGEIWFAPDYDKADEEILEMFEESINKPFDEESLSLLVDTNVLLWWFAGKRLAPDLVERLEYDDAILISVVSPWECWIKAQSGKLVIPSDFEDRLNRGPRLTILPPTLDDARRAASLPMIHRDPFDRIIVAQALNRRATLVTGDRHLADYGVQTILV